MKKLKGATVINGDVQEATFIEARKTTRRNFMALKLDAPKILLDKHLTRSEYHVLFALLSCYEPTKMQGCIYKPTAQWIGQETSIFPNHVYKAYTSLVDKEIIFEEGEEKGGNVIINFAVWLVY